MFALLALGAALGAWRQPELLQRLGEVPIGWRWPPLFAEAFGEFLRQQLHAARKRTRRMS